MATYRLSMNVAKRSDGKNAVAMAAYRAGAELRSDRTGETLDFTRKQGILHSEIVLPVEAPGWAADREVLWNRSEAADRRGDSVVAREIQLSLPHELTAGQRRDVTLGFARSLADRYGIAVDVNIHAPDHRGDERNHHAHLLLCTRSFDPEKKTGFGNKLREFDAVAHQRTGTENLTEALRQEWCDRLNDALSRAHVRGTDGAAVTLDHRSYERQGVDREPSVKLGPAASAMERRGETSERGDENRAVAARNKERKQLQAELDQLELLTRRQAHRLTGPELVAGLGASGASSPGNPAAEPELQQYSVLLGDMSMDENQRRLQQQQARLEELRRVANDQRASLGNAPAVQVMENRRLEFAFDPTGDLQEQFRMHELHLGRLDFEDRETLKQLKDRESSEFARKLQVKHTELREGDLISAARAGKDLPLEVREDPRYRQTDKRWYDAVNGYRYEERGRLTEAFEREHAQVHQGRRDTQKAQAAGYQKQLQQAYDQAERERASDWGEVAEEPSASVRRHTARSGIEELHRNLGLLERGAASPEPSQSERASDQGEADKALPDPVRRHTARSGIEELSRNMGLPERAADSPEPSRSKDEEEQRKRRWNFHR